MSKTWITEDGKVNEMKPLLFLAEKSLMEKFFRPSKWDVSKDQWAKDSYSKMALAQLSRLTYGYDKTDHKV